ncbi:MAG: tRNA (adenosine(37)-N6)-dimethylallyltransferase MiaA [Acidimicrobiales bacterium]
MVGATGTGKSLLATAVAARLAGDGVGVEVVSVDAMAVYRGLDVLTAKPAPAAGVHLVDLVEADEDFSVADFTTAARLALDQIHRQGHRAVLVGGTGLYHRAVLDGLDLPGRFPAVAASLELEATRPGGLAALYEQLRRLDPMAAARVLPANRRRIVRALEVTLGSGRPFSSFGPGLESYPEARACLVGLRLPREELYLRLDDRLEAQLEAGLLDEVRQLRARARPISRTAAQAIGYVELSAHLAGEGTLDEALARTRRRLRSFARRQEAWFRRDPRVVWLDARRPDLVESVVAQWSAEEAKGQTWETAVL